MIPRAAALFSLLAVAVAISPRARNSEAAQQPQAAQSTPTAAPDSAASEEQEYRRAMSQSNVSAGAFIQAMEKHLADFPRTPHRAEIERTLASAALEMNDRKRIAQYGEALLNERPDDLLLLVRVTRALLDSDDRRSSEHALEYARRYERGVRALIQRVDAAHAGSAELRDALDEQLGRALVYQSLAAGNLGRWADAVDLGRKSYALYPTAESARETARWLSRMGKDEDAIAWYADGLTIPDESVTQAKRDSDRVRVIEKYRKLKGSDAGVEALIRQSTARTAAAVRDRQIRIDKLSRSSSSALFAFVLPGVAGEDLALSSLRGKVLVLDFWAIWCGPCRVQHPLFEEVKKRFAKRRDVVFLSIDTDDDRAGVGRFLDAQHWDKKVYFDDGLALALEVNSIPATMLVNKRGEIEVRMPGFNPGTYVDRLSGSIQRALDE
jgi:thiol-disulfide isomerase/thioredoxin